MHPPFGNREIVSNASCRYTKGLQYWYNAGVLWFQGLSGFSGVLSGIPKGLKIAYLHLNRVKMHTPEVNRAKVHTPD